LIVAVMVDEPNGKEHFGGQVAAPAFSSVMNEALRSLDVPYDAPLDNVIVAPDAALIEEDV
jgi:cell division protein FtsI (penicillin-binding protein 3)